MTVHIDISNRQKMNHLLELLKSMDFVERVRVEDDQAADSTPSPFFDKFYGSAPNLDVDAFENYLTVTRNEWERPRS